MTDWKTKPILAIWEAACIWAGRPPSAIKRRETAEYEKLVILRRDWRYGKLKLHELKPIFSQSTIKRNDLKEYMQIQGYTSKLDL